MTVFDKVNELVLKEYNVSTITELKAAIIDAEYQKITNKYLNEAKLRIVRKKQNEANKYKPTDKEIVKQLQARLDVAI